MATNCLVEADCAEKNGKVPPILRKFGKNLSSSQIANPLAYRKVSVVRRINLMFSRSSDRELSFILHGEYQRKFC